MKKFLILLLLPFMLVSKANAADHYVFMGYVNWDTMADNTAIFQAYLDQSNSNPAESWEYIFPEGTFYINATVGLKPHSNTTLIMSGTTLRALPNSSAGSRLIRIQNANNVTIKGWNNSKIVGDRLTHLVVGGGEWGMGIEMLSSSNVSISNLTIEDTFGDNIYIGTGMSNVSIVDVKLNRARRQGISVISCVTCRIADSIISDTMGVDHSSTVGSPNDGILYQGIGIDFESNFATELLNDITVDSVLFKNNRGGSVKFYASNPKWTNVSNVKIIDSTMIGNSSSAPSFAVSNAGAKAAGADLTVPSILVKGNTIHLKNNGIRGVEAIALGSAKYTRVELNTIVNDTRNPTTGGMSVGVYAPATTEPSVGNVVTGNIISGVAAALSPANAGVNVVNNLVNP